MHFRSLTVIVTLRCIAQCTHCATNSSPGRAETIEASLAAQAVEEAAQAGLSLVMSGGEPLLEFQLVEDLAKRASKYGISVAVCSNGYWGRTPEQATRIVDRLSSAGVDTLLLSTDVYHLPFVPLDAVESAARAAVAAGMYCEIAVPSPADDPVTSEEIVASLKHLPQVLVKVHPVSRTGRAIQLASRVFAHGVYDRRDARRLSLRLLRRFHRFRAEQRLVWGKPCRGHFTERDVKLG
jgi:MoaA/NifB/PqqE/SkfB family radical SAM enzyme